MHTLEMFLLLYILTYLIQFLAGQVIPILTNTKEIPLRRHV